jgi:predicted nucleotidyltransferase
MATAVHSIAIGDTGKPELAQDPHLERLVCLLQRYEPDQIILFGSRARGEADAYSDYDVIVIKRTDRPFLERLRDMVPYLVESENRRHGSWNHGSVAGRC